MVSRATSPRSRSPARQGQRRWCGRPSVTPRTTSSTARPSPPPGPPGTGPRSAPTPRRTRPHCPTTAPVTRNRPQRARSAAGRPLTPLPAAASRNSLSPTPDPTPRRRPAGVTYLDTPMPAGWTPPIAENANEQPWEQNPYFNPALTAVGITTVGADPSQAYPTPPDAQF